MNQTNTSKRIPTQINEFRGDYAFLSNFYPAPVSYMGQTYANNEAAFQAQKTLSAREQRKFCIFRMHNPSDAKNIEKTGSRHIATNHGEVIRDSHRPIFTTPCYMLDADIVQIAEGAENIVQAILDELKQE